MGIFYNTDNKMFIFNHIIINYFTTKSAISDISWLYKLAAAQILPFIVNFLDNRFRIAKIYLDYQTK